MTNKLVIHIPDKSNDTTYFCTGCSINFQLATHTAHECSNFKDSAMHKELNISRTTGYALEEMGSSNRIITKKTVMGAMAQAELDAYHASYQIPDNEQRIIDPNTGGEKGQKTIRLHAIPWEALQLLGKVYTFGENKYTDYNFRKGYVWSLSYDAMQRHLWAFWSGEDTDKESKLPHLAHAIWHGLTLLLFAETGKGTDDRPKL